MFLSNFISYFVWGRFGFVSETYPFTCSSHYAIPSNLFLISFALSRIVTALIPETSEILTCLIFSWFFNDERYIAAAAIPMGFLLVFIPLFCPICQIFIASRFVFSDAFVAFAILATNSIGLYDSGCMSSSFKINLEIL